MGFRNTVIKTAFKKGYRVSKCGEIVQYKNRTRKLQTKKVGSKMYFRFTISFEGRSVNILVHRLQAYQKYRGKAFKENLVVRHKNDNSLDNSWGNILMGTQAQNMQDKIKNNVHKL